MSTEPLTLSSPPALLIVDMQNTFCHPNGVFVKAGIQVPPSTMTRVTHQINALRTAFHTHNFPVIFVGYAFNEDYSNSGLIWEIPGGEQMKANKILVRGSWDAGIIDELKPDEGKGEVVLEKYRNSAFAAGTKLEEVLRSKGVQQVVVCGCATNVCVESTVRDAAGRDWRCMTVDDACAALTTEAHDASLKNLQWQGGVCDTAQVEEALNRISA
ncbi:hypothetical protein M409DRAFT_16045 [Zasmidium cellare ATCC 36951]|uniref:Isochorismatase-like domain-containing protein n=1 Tax=Zasmidium cellare ATCC 36951 TaxID=1080233 RepID=A0A6A6D3T6_ZASCE|nr:uncharacterized protein M409DRAFT_16045 [Zasmidium cellare ATCC 36951]KAF2173773.1 hypothetical protein M409DRAFT_16045 [Zasmidium cellare ATCC 36951]